VSMLVSSVSSVVESLFATLFPSDCRLCGAPLVNLSRLPVRGERVFSPYARDTGETRCGLCRRREPPFVKAVAYGSYDGGLRGILLVDDVFTTGTTVSECARVLRRAGASKVFVATVARTLKADAQGVDMAQSLVENERTLAATG
jgi:predicted amidophosphoribosyltransferase